jgi:hypothetical protein
MNILCLGNNIDFDLSEYNKNDNYHYMDNMVVENHTNLDLDLDSDFDIYYKFDSDKVVNKNVYDLNENIVAEKTFLEIVEQKAKDNPLKVVVVQTL